MKTIFKFLIAISLFSIATVYADTIITPLEGAVPIGVNQDFVVGYDELTRKFCKVRIRDIPIGWQ